MQQRNCRLHAAAAVLILGSASLSFAQETPEELRKEIQALRERVNQLEADQRAVTDGLRQGTEDTASVQTATRAQVLRDAESRSDVLAGYEQGKFFLKSADGNFSLSPGAQLQIRYTANSRDDADNDLQDGFEIRRAKFFFAGHAFSKDFTYNLQWETNENGGVVTLEEAWVRYQFRDDMALRLGQIKDSPFHEETVSSKRQLAVDRSLLNELIAGGETDYVQAVRLEWDATEALRADIGLQDGYNSDNTPFLESGGTSFVGVGPTDWGTSARVELFAIGADAKKQYDDFTALKNKQDILVFGGGANYSMAGNNHAFFHTVDAQYENASGFGLYAAVIGLDRQASSGPAAAPELNLYDWGALVQAGYMLNADYEIFGRWDVTVLDDAALAADDEDTFNEFTLGVNRYIRGHAAKLTLDASYLPDGAPQNESGVGVLASEEEQFILRGQFQLLL